MNHELWQYQARYEQVKDGDTVRVIWDLGDDVHKSIDVRVQDVDTTEKAKGDPLSRAWAAAAKQFTTDWCEEAVREGPKWPLMLHTQPNRKGRVTKSFTRYVAHIRRVHDGEELTQQVIASGYGIGAKKRAAGRRPLGVVWPGDWTREAGKRGRVHLIAQVTPGEIRTACGRVIGDPSTVGVPSRSGRCSRCWRWCAFSTDLWAEIVAKNVLLQYGGEGTVFAQDHPGALLL